LPLVSGRAGFRPGGQGSFGVTQDRPFVSAKGPKTISTRVSTLNRSDASYGGADQLAGLGQGLIFDLDVSSISQLGGGELYIHLQA